MVNKEERRVNKNKIKKQQWWQQQKTRKIKKQKIYERACWKTNGRLDSSTWVEQSWDGTK